MPEILGSQSKDQDRLIDGQILNERTLRYRRNVLALSFIILVLSLSPELDFSSLSIFGISFKANAAVTTATVWSFLTVLFFFQVLSFGFEVYYDWRGWSHKVRKEITSGYLSFVFFMWPPEGIYKPIAWRNWERIPDDVRWTSVVSKDRLSVIFTRGWLFLSSEPEPNLPFPMPDHFWQQDLESVTVGNSLLRRTRHRLVYFGLWEAGLPLAAAALAWVKLPWQHVWHLIQRIFT